MTKIIAIGDSITRWANDLEELWRVNRMKKHFDNNNVDQETQVYNCWISGNTSEDLLPRFSIETKSRAKNDKNVIIILAIWINDSIILNDSWKNQVDSPIFEQNINQLIDLAKPYQVIILWLTNINEQKTNLCSREPQKSFKVSEVKKYDEILEKISKERNIQYINLKGILTNKDLSDWLHPNHIGHQKIAEKVLKELPKI